MTIEEEHKAVLFVGRSRPGSKSKEEHKPEQQLEGQDELLQSKVQ